MTESVKTKKSFLSWKMFDLEFKFSKFLSIRSKEFYLGVSEQTKQLTANIVQHTFCVTDRLNWHLSKKMKKNIC